jgi:nickel-dependent lactate racemase
VKKIGRYAADRLDVYNNYPYQNLSRFGYSNAGTPIKLCRYFGEADLKISIGGITPHGGPGFGGGAKTVFPGVASFETVSSMHKPGRLKGGLLKVDGNDLRSDIEDMANKVGLDFIINTVTNSQRQIAGIFTGHYIHAHRAGVTFAKKVFATDLPAEPVDIAICNAYPKDTDFLQAGLALTILNSEQLHTGPKCVVKENGVIVIITASPEGRGHHALYGPGMIYGRRSLKWREDPWLWKGRRIIHFSPNISPRDARNALTYGKWSEVISYLEREYTNPTVAVFPCGSIQLSRDSLDD